MQDARILGFEFDPHGQATACRVSGVVAVFSVCLRTSEEPLYRRRLNLHYLHLREVFRHSYLWLGCCQQSGFEQRAFTGRDCVAARGLGVWGSWCRAWGLVGRWGHCEGLTAWGTGGLGTERPSKRRAERSRDCNLQKTPRGPQSPGD